MKEITLNDVNYLRNRITSITVDETNLEFKNGIAVAEAHVDAIDFWNEPYSYNCMGLIDENFHEVYNDTHHGNGVKERNLMFLQYNRNIIRCGDNDFIVEVDCCDDGRSWTEYRHVRIVDGIPILITDKLSHCQITNHENLVISGFSSKKLYDVTTGEFITPSLFDIKESKINTEVFDVVAKITSGEEKNPRYVEYLYFKINTKGQRVSYILSSLVKGCVSIWGDSVVELLEVREKELKIKFEDFVRMVTEFENDNSYLKNYEKDLKRSLKKEERKS